jgi:hypothetical protein
VVEARKEGSCFSRKLPTRLPASKHDWNNESKNYFDAAHAIENLIYRYSSQFGTFLHQDREKLRLSTREYVLYVSW